MIIICGKEANKKSSCSLHLMVSVDWTGIDSVEFASKEATVFCCHVKYTIGIKELDN
jgi:hypothetical protein